MIIDTLKILDTIPKIDTLYRDTVSKLIIQTDTFDWDKLIDVIIAALCASIFTLFFRIIYEKYVDNKRRRTIEDNMNSKIITQTTLCKLLPGKSIANMKQLLGQPLIHRDGSLDIYEWAEDLRNPKFAANLEKKKTLQCYIYKFKNINIKITSVDDKTIDSLTIVPHLKQQVDITDLIKDELILNKSKFKFDNTNFDFKVTSIIDYLIIVRVTRLSPLNRNYSFFFIDYEESKKYYESDNVDDLKGAIINGVCITDYGNNEIHYIFDSELV